MKPLTPEMLRILHAIADDRFGVNVHGRYFIYADPKRPDRRSRELLAKRGLIEKRYVQGVGNRYVITSKGWDVLEAINA